MACALKSEGEPKMSVKLSKQQWAMQSVPLSKVCDLPDTSPKDGAGPSDSGMYDRGSRTHPDGGAAVDVSRVAEAYEEVVRDLGAWIQFWQLTRAGRRGSTEGSGSEGSRGAPIFSSDGAMLGFSCTQRPTAQGDLTEQLHDVIAASPAHAVLMGEVGMQLLALCCDLGWASMARWVLQVGWGCLPACHDYCREQCLHHPRMHVCMASKSEYRPPSRLRHCGCVLGGNLWHPHFTPP